MTILLADLRGFTAISESHPARVVLDVLNRYLAKMCEIVVRHGGVIDKFMGDAIMALFGAPRRHPDDPGRAVTCAVEMQFAMLAINRRHQQLGLPRLYMGAGVNTGIVLAGRLGSKLHSEYTVIGDAVNLASRIESFSLRGQVLISDHTFTRCRDLVTTDEPFSIYVKGKNEPIVLREVLAIPTLGLEVPRQELRKGPRVEVKIPFSYQAVEHKAVLPRVYQGVVLDLSYHGILAAMEQPLDPGTDIKMGLDLSLIGYQASDIYAKVLDTRHEDSRSLSRIEFTSVSVRSNLNIKHFVQLLIQGSVTK